MEARLQEQASADAALQTAQANLQGAGQDVNRLKAERAALVQQRANARLFAPAHAIVTSRDAEAGSTVVAGQPVLRLIDPNSLWVKLRVDQGRSSGLVSGLKADIVLRSRPRDTLPGRVARVELLADAVTEERLTQVAFEPLPSGVSVGEMAEVTLQLPAIDDALLLPNASIVYQQGQPGVWRLTNDAPEFVKVTLGASSLNGQVQVLGGVQAEDRVVAYSEKTLTNGARIKVVDHLFKPAAQP